MKEFKIKSPDEMIAEAMAIYNDPVKFKETTGMTKEEMTPQKARAFFMQEMQALIDHFENKRK